MFSKSQEHLAEAKMTYFTHLTHGCANGCILIFAGVTSIAHAIVPSSFKSYSVLTVVSLYREIKKRRHLQKFIR